MNKLIYQTENEETNQTHERESADIDKMVWQNEEKTVRIRNPDPPSQFKCCIPCKLIEQSVHRKNVARDMNESIARTESIYAVLLVLLGCYTI